MPSEFSGLDIEEMGRVIDEAGVLIIRFHVIPQRLLVDTRESAEDSPQLRLVPPVSSAEERYATLEAAPGVRSRQITVLSWLLHRVMREPYLAAARAAHVRAGPRRAAALREVSTSPLPSAPRWSPDHSAARATSPSGSVLPPRRPLPWHGDLNRPLC